MSFSHKTLGSIVAALAVGGLAAAPGHAADAAKTTIRIGALIDVTGASTTPLFRSAVELAARQVNEALAKSGSPLVFEVPVGDTKSAPATAQAEALRLINDEKVVALVSDSSGDTIAVNRLNYDPASPARQKVPLTCFQCSSSAINDPNVTESDAVTQAAERDADNWLFRVFYDAKFEAAVIGRIAVQKARKAPGTPLKIGVFADAGHKSLATLIPEKLGSFHSGPSSVEIIYASAPDKIAADWGRVLDAKNETSGASDGPPDVVIVAMLPAGATEAIKAYRQGGYKVPILSNNSFRRDYILKGVGAPAEGLEGSSVTLVDKGPSGRAFVNAFKAAYGQTPEVTAPGAYDATVSLMLAAMQAAGDLKKPHPVTPAEIRQAMTRINARKATVIRPTAKGFEKAVETLSQGKPINYQGAYDSLNWDAVGNIYPPMVHWKVENGRFVELELYSCTPRKPLCPPVTAKPKS